MAEDLTDYDKFNRKYEKLLEFEENIEDYTLEDFIIDPLEDYTLEDIEIELIDIETPVLEESKELKETNKKYANMTSKEIHNKCMLDYIKFLKKRKKELPEYIKKQKEVLQDINKRYEETKDKEIKKLLNCHQLIIKSFEDEYNSIDKNIEKIRKYIDNV